MKKLVVNEVLGQRISYKTNPGKNVFHAILAIFLLHCDHSFSNLGFQDRRLFICEVHKMDGRGGDHQILVRL